MAIILCKKTKTKACYWLYSIGGKFAHDHTCKCKSHIQGYIGNFATTKEIEKGIKVGKAIKPKCVRCKKIDYRPQRNITNTSVWEQNDGSIIVRI